MRATCQLSAVAVCAVLTTLASVAFGQAADVQIEPRRFPSGAPTSEVLAALAELKAAGQLLSIEQVAAALHDPTPQQVRLPAARTEALRASSIATQLRGSSLRIGWYHLCTRCNNWHLNIAGGYLLTPDGVGATCHHVLLPSRQTMREGYLFAMSETGGVFPITQILAADRESDAAIFKLSDARGLVPLPINDQARPGDSVFLRSDPGGVAGYFSAGVINRFYWDGNKRSGDPTTLEDARSLRMDVSTAWSPGSSGAALVDECGNVVGDVSKIFTIMAADPLHQNPAPSTNPATQGTTTTPPAARPPVGTHLVLHEAIPIRAIRLLIEKINRDINEPTEATPPTAPTGS